MLKRKNNLSDYHTDIDTLPLQNWIECHNGNLEKTRINKKGTPELDEMAWDKIQDDHLKRFKISKQLLKIYTALSKKAQRELDFVITEDASNLTLAEVENEKVKSILSNNNKGITIQQSLVYLSQWMNQWINTRQITTLEYFNLLDELEKFNKSQQQTKKK